MLTNEQKNVVLSLMGTMTDKAVAKIAEVSPSEVFYYRTLAGVPASRNRRWNAERVKELVNFKVSHTLEECAKHFGLTVSSFNTLMTVLRKKGHAIPYVYNK